jgi:hypothetical protein
MRSSFVILPIAATVVVAAIWAQDVTVRLSNLAGELDMIANDVIGRLDDLSASTSRPGRL